MYRFLLKPKWLAFHLACLVAVVGMVELGFWQLRRLDERASFNDRVSEHSQAPVAPLDELLPLSRDDAEYRRAEATGVYEPGQQFLVVNVSQDGVTGRNVVNALRLADGTLIIVNRGFAPAGTSVPAAPEGIVTVVGRLKNTQRAVTGQPRDDGSQQLTEIRRVDLGALEQQFDAPVASMYIELLSSDPAEPDSLQAIRFPTLDSGPHLSYAAQWFIFTTFVIIGWVFAVRRHAREIGALPPKPRRGPPPIAEEYW